MILPHNNNLMNRPRNKRNHRLVLLLTLLLVVLVITAGLCWRSVFVMDETQTTLVLSFGRQLHGPIVEAGLHFKRPWQTVRKFDRRLQLLEFEPREKLTYDHEPVVVQPYACWRIAPEETERYLRSVRNLDGAEITLTDLIWRALDHELSTHTLTDWVNTIGEYAPAGLLSQTRIMNDVARSCREEARQYFGIELLDVHLLRLTRPEWMKEDIYRRTIADRERTADRLRQASTAQIIQIKADAQQEVDRVLAQAKSQARAIRAESKAQADRLSNEARRLDPELAALAEKLESYRKLLDGKATLVLSGDPEIFGAPAAPPPEQQQNPVSQPAPATQPGG